MRRAGLALCVVLALTALSAELTPEELRGRKIYRTGESPSGVPILAFVGPEDLELPATSLPCMSCHGRDGRGKEEGGVRPSNLQWHVLTKPYSVESSAGRAHPPYTPALLKRAIAMGTDPAKQKLNPVMPRYQLSMRDADDLIAYLQRIGTDDEPGLTDDTVVIGIQAPDDAPVRAHFEEINKAGGIFGRRLRIAAVDEEPFAILSIGGAPTARTDGPYVFEFLATLEEQSLALMGEQKVRIVHDETTADVAARLASHVDPKSSTVLLLARPSTLPNAQTLLVPAAFTTDAILSAPMRVLVAVPTTRNTPDTALAAATTFTRALEQAGRDLDRETLATLLKPARRNAVKEMSVVRVKD